MTTTNTTSLPVAFPAPRTKRSDRATMTVSSDIRAIDGNDDNGTEYAGTATVVWSVTEAGSTSRYSKRFESRDAANAWANEKWGKVK